MIRKLIRSILNNERNSLSESFPNSLYDEDDIWNKAIDLVEDLEINLTAEKDLRFFINEGEDVVGAAFTFCNDNYFGFTIAVDSNYEELREELIVDCLEEYDIYSSTNSNLMIEIDDFDLENTLLEDYGFHKIENRDGRAILSDLKRVQNDYL